MCLTILPHPITPPYPRGHLLDHSMVYGVDILFISTYNRIHVDIMISHTRFYWDNVHQRSSSKLFFIFIFLSPPRSPSPLYLITSSFPSRHFTFTRLLHNNDEYRILEQRYISNTNIPHRNDNKKMIVVIIKYDDDDDEQEQ